MIDTITIAKQTSPDYSGKRFLVVDDKHLGREMLRGMLETCHARSIHGAGSADEAIEILGDPDERIDCVLCDSAMAPVNGLELARLVRLGSLPHTARHLPFILTTGRLDEMLLKGVKELDISGLLAKPVALNKLVEAVDLAFAHQVSVKRHQDYLRLV